MANLLKITLSILLTFGALTSAQAINQALSTKDIVISSMLSEQGETLTGSSAASGEKLAISVLTEGPFDTWISNNTDNRYASGQRFRVKISAPRAGQLAFFNTTPRGDTAKEPVLIMQLDAGVEAVSEALEITGASGVDLLHLVLLPQNSSDKPYEVFRAMQRDSNNTKDIRLISESSENTTYFRNPKGSGAFVTLTIDHSDKQVASKSKPSDISSEEKFLSPALVNYAGMAVFQAFNTWIGARMSPQMEGERKPELTELLWPIGIQLVQTAYTNWVDSLNNGTAQWVELKSEPLKSSVVVIGQPDIPLNAAPKNFSDTATWPSTRNYQGVGLAILAQEKKGEPLIKKPLSSKLSPGQPFKLQVTSTEDSIVMLDHIASGKTNRLYPNTNGNAVRIKAGETIQLPLGSGEFFSTNSMGANDLFRIHVMQTDKPITKTTSTNPVYRVSTDTATLYTQRTLPNAGFGMSQLFAPHH
jgi:hypothetical protein